MTLQNWLEQEEDSWIKAGKPDGWCSGWIKDGVSLGSSVYSVRVSFWARHKLIELNNQEESK